MIAFSVLLLCLFSLVDLKRINMKAHVEMLKVNHELTKTTKQLNKLMKYLSGMLSNLQAQQKEAQTFIAQSNKYMNNLMGTSNDVMQKTALAGNMARNAASLSKLAMIQSLRESMDTVHNEVENEQRQIKSQQPINVDFLNANNGYNMMNPMNPMNAVNPVNSMDPMNQYLQQQQQQLQDQFQQPQMQQPQMQSQQFVINPNSQTFSSNSPQQNMPINDFRMLNQNSNLPNNNNPRTPNQFNQNNANLLNGMSALNEQLKNLQNGLGNGQRNQKNDILDQLMAEIRE